MYSLLFRYQAIDGHKASSSPPVLHSAPPAFPYRFAQWLLMEIHIVVVVVAASNGLWWWHLPDSVCIRL